MNRERAKELLPIIEAFANGEDIQYQTMGVWRKSEGIFADHTKYRIKPKPREWDLIPSRLGLATRKSNEHDCECIRVREVLDETM